MSDPLRVIINAQIPSGGEIGGMKQFIIGLLFGLGQLKDGSEEYIIISSWQNPNWLNPYIGPNERIIEGHVPGLKSRVKNILRKMSFPAIKVWDGIKHRIIKNYKLDFLKVPKSNGFFESLNANLIHFPFQHLINCNLPMIYNPHDLQHLHYPQFFMKEIIDGREFIYPTSCRLAQAVVAESKWMKEDIIKQYHINPNKIYVIYRGSPTAFYPKIMHETLIDVREKFQLPETFSLYPAQTWPHKNHISLLKAVKFLRDRYNLSINLVCTGIKNEFWPNIKNYINKLSLNNQVYFLGYVTDRELRALYHLAQFVVFPSLFEGGGFPITEALYEGIPIACSAATSMPEYGGDAVLLFNPKSVIKIAEAMKRLALDDKLRETLRQRGFKRIQEFSWKKTAKKYRALYRKIANCSLSEEDRILLADD
ncbi:MAG: glycosyltransferase family 4 protein [Candidatus Hodarchaeota archaeon]